ncbi:FAD-dependent oxidoreductase [Alkalihalobacterium bogoriense]|uniref:FAD-dependent oxidoreductase n=1 Tax=Alkalihalobacterium bogoriense TaxID=246272 RepID=UPI0009FEEE79|nr:FAD-dependent oxidoreductase [Alkalihalobacterium bogoriense]
MSRVKKETTKQKIVNAAIKLFQEKGFETTTVQEITAKANVAKGTFFNYFPTKDSIMQSLALERIQEITMQLENPSFFDSTFLANVRKLLGTLLTDYDKNPELTKLTWSQRNIEQSLLLAIWEKLCKQAIERKEMFSYINITVWSHILNSQFYYSLTMFGNSNSKKECIDHMMQLISTCVSGILVKRGNLTMQKLVILGGGYGGMRILQRLLTNDLPTDVEVTLVDKMPYHCLKTEYYALAAGTEPDLHLRVNYPKDPRLTIKFGFITSIDLDSKLVHLNNEESIPYDTLIVGLGCEDKYHNVPGAPEHTFSIQSMEATRRTYEQLSNVRPNGIVSIVGAGLSGVELASELRESRSDLTIKLFDRGEIILSAFPKKLSNYVQNWFLDHGVEVINKSNITKVEPNVLYNHDEPVECDAIIWTAGIQPNKVVRDLDVAKDQQGRVIITPHHHLPTDENVFIVGDCASLPHAPSAQLAEGQGEQIVSVLKARWNNETLPDILPKIKLKGVLGSLGKKHGFGLMGERTLIGRVPRVLKSGVLWMYKYHSG